MITEATTVAPYGSHRGSGNTEIRAPRLNALQLVPAAPRQAIQLQTAWWLIELLMEISLDSIKDFDGTARGTESSSAFVDGKAGFGKAIKLDGTDQFVEITRGDER